MTNYVVSFIARQLGVPAWAVVEWRVSAGGRAFGSLEANLEVQLNCSYAQLGSLRDRFDTDETGALIVVSMAHSNHSERGAEVHLTLTCLYGKETQHLFKALHQQFTVRGRPPKRRKK